MSDRSRGRTDELNLELRDLATRDLQLWSIALLILVVLTVGVFALVLPNLLWNSTPIRVDGRFLPQLVAGFIALIVLFNVYLVDQKRRLNKMRDRLVRKLLTEEQTESVLLDSLTGLYTKQSVDQLLPRETAGVDRTGRPLTFMYIDIAGFRAVNQRHGTLAGDHLLLVFTKMLKSNFRGSDLISRFGGDEFVVLLPETTSSQAEIAAKRLTSTVAAWNVNTAFPYKLELQIGMATYVRGCIVADVLQTARANSFANSASASSERKAAQLNWQPAQVQLTAPYK